MLRRTALPPWRSSARTDSAPAGSKPPAIIKTLAERGWSGEKAGQGFYKRERGGGSGSSAGAAAADRSEILTLDPESGQATLVAALGGTWNTGVKMRIETQDNRYLRLIGRDGTNATVLGKVVTVLRRV